MAEQRIRSAAEGFERNADAYERARPSYPADVVARIVGYGALGPGRQVLDLAAGTGKLTRLLVASGADVVAVDPVAAMRDRLSAVLPDVVVVDGTAEAIPWPDGAFDVVTVAQGFHWFDPSAALAEIARVLRPGGHLFLVWNMRVRTYDWVRCFGDLLVDGDLERPYDEYYSVDYAAVVAEAGANRYTPVERWSTTWEQTCDEDLLVGRAESVSVVGTRPDGERAAVLDRVRALARTHPDLADRPWWGFPYETAVWHTRTLDA